MWLNASCTLEFQIPSPTPFVMMLRPRSGTQQWIAKEEYMLSPSVPAVEFTDSFGNLCQRLIAPAGYFSVHTSVAIDHYLNSMLAGIILTRGNFFDRMLFSDF